MTLLKAAVQGGVKVADLRSDAAYGVLKAHKDYTALFDQTK